jgi:hypothetical protein
MTLLCEHMGELHEATEKENEHPVEKKKDSQRHLRNECE